MKQGVVQPAVYKASIPFETRYGLIIINLKVNNKNYDFILDTGMDITAVTPKVAKELGLKTVETNIITDIHQQKLERPVVILDNVEMNQVRWQQTAAFVTDFNQGMFKCLGVEGILGANLMNKSILYLDFEQKMVHFVGEREQLNIGEAAYRLSFESHYAPDVDLTIGRVTLRDVTFDTGNNGTSVLPHSFFTRVDSGVIPDYVVREGSSSMGVSGYGKQEADIVANVPKWSIGDFTSKNTVFEFKKETISSLGSSFIKQFNSIINWKNQTIELFPVAEPELEEKLSYGFEMVYAKDVFQVVALYKNSNAAQKGLCIGDKIVTINDKDIRAIVIPEACNYSLRNYKGRLKLGVERDGKVKYYTLEKVPLFKN